MKEQWVLKKILNKNFSFSDVDSKLNGIESSTSNIFCVFHEHNYNTPSAKIYYDYDEDIYTWHCFKEKRTYTTFDYVQKILCEKYEIYKNVEEFLEEKLGKVELDTLYNEYKELTKNDLDSKIDKKIEYIDNVYNNTLNIYDYIEELYTA